MCLYSLFLLYALCLCGRAPVASAVFSIFFLTEIELLAALESIRNWRPYLWGRRFKLVIDHAALRWLHTMKDQVSGGPASRLTRWALRFVSSRFIHFVCNLRFDSAARAHGHGRAGARGPNGQTTRVLYCRCGLVGHPAPEIALVEASGASVLVRKVMSEASLPKTPSRKGW
eukprot:scaffold10997_cov119-Isochrysis_galbana.AAC.2